VIVWMCCEWVFDGVVVVVIVFLVECVGFDFGW
jgi:hypothetical protein